MVPDVEEGRRESFAPRPLSTVPRVAAMPETAVERVHGRVFAAAWEVFNGLLILVVLCTAGWAIGYGIWLLGGHR